MAARSNVSALNPAFWSAMMQIPLRKSLVAAEVADTKFKETLKKGDTVHFPYWSELSVTDYDPGTAITGFEDITGTDETLIVDKKKIVRWYVDDIEELQSNYQYSMTLADDAAYQLRDNIDTAVLLNVTGAASAVDDGDLGGTSGSAITATSANVIDVYVQARKKLRQMNVEESGDWISVVTPTFASLIERKTSETGFSVADASLRNGFAGSFLGFKVYVSNNMPSAAYGGTDSDHLYFGRGKQIDLVTQVMPKMDIKDVQDRLGKNFIASTVYGTKLFEKAKNRFVKVPVEG